jgi:hypothetical protein
MVVKESCSCVATNELEDRMKDVLLASVFVEFPSQKSLAKKYQLHSQITRTYDKNALKSQASLIWDKQFDIGNVEPVTPLMLLPLKLEHNIISIDISYDCYT